MLRFLLVLLLLLSFSVTTFADGSLTAIQLQRVRQYKNQLSEVNSEPLDKTIDWLAAQRYPEIHLQIEEAVAQSYTQLIKEHQLTKLKDKRWLYGMIKLNVAYLQFTAGQEGASGADAALNRLIQRTLKKYLSPEIFNHPGFVKSVG